jgi:hypothetical protein
VQEKIAFAQERFAVGTPLRSNETILNAKAETV